MTHHTLDMTHLKILHRGGRYEEKDEYDLFERNNFYKFNGMLWSREKSDINGRIQRIQSMDERHGPFDVVASRRHY